MARASKTTEKIIEAAEQPTADGVLSVASETQPVVGDATVESDAVLSVDDTLAHHEELLAETNAAESFHPGLGVLAVPTAKSTDGDRISALEADLAFLRGVFGWPTKDA